MLRRQWAQCAIRRISGSYSSPPGIRNIAIDSRVLRISPEIQQAVAEKRPVVALESTIYTHGWSAPDNLSLASRLESLVRINGGIPATIGILDGVACVGVGADELVRLLDPKRRSSTLKISRRDLGFACALNAPDDGRPYNGGTTVAGTMILAHLAGIRVFATGGLGGVHRGAEQTMDVSADLTELGRTPVAVVSSGCKSFLDIPKTLEYLETQGVAVATFADGRKGPVDFPAFWSRDSGVRSPFVVSSEADAARVIHFHLSLGLQSGLLFANPIPEVHSIPHAQTETTIAQALQDAHAAGATGAASTPYILSKIKELTGSTSVAANKALVEANVIRGTKIAVELATLQQHRDKKQSVSIASIGGFEALSNTKIDEMQEQPHQNSQSVDAPHADIFVAGSINIDRSCDFTPPAGSSNHFPELETSNPAIITESLGGVGYNVARAAHLLGARVRLCSAVGSDVPGEAAVDALAKDGLSTAGIYRMPKATGLRTSQYVAINDSAHDLWTAMADVSILEDNPTDPTAMETAFSSLWTPSISSNYPSHLILDANWSPAHLSRWLTLAHQTSAHVTFEPVSNAKASRLFQLPTETFSLSVFPSPSVHLATPNATELKSLYLSARDSGALERKDWWAVIDALGIPSTGARVALAAATNARLVDQGVPQQSIQLLPFIPTICTKLGAEGVLVTQLLAAGDPRSTDGAYAPYILSRCANGSEDELGVGGVYIRLFPAAEKVRPEEIVSVNGVGDTFCGALVAGLAKRGKEAGRVEELVEAAQRAAVLALKSRESVSPELGSLRGLV